MIDEDRPVVQLEIPGTLALSPSELACMIEQVPMLFKPRLWKRQAYNGDSI